MLRAAVLLCWSVWRRLGFAGTLDGVQTLRLRRRARRR